MYSSLRSLGVVFTLTLTCPTLLFTPSSQAARPVSSDSRTYVYPKVNGKLVDRCLYWGKQCNGPAADYFCRLKGYDKAAEFQWAYKNPTLILGSKKVCNIKKGCGAISRVRCVKAGGSSGHQPGTGSGRIVARIERKAYNCKEAGKLGSRYVSCQVKFSLLNSSNQPIHWSSGKWETAYGPTTKMSRRSVGYKHSILRPKKKEVYTLWCNVPKGRGNGVMSAWGSGRHKNDSNKNRFKWKVAFKCP